MITYYVPTKSGNSTRIVEVVEKTDNFVAVIATGRIKGEPFKRVRITTMAPRSFAYKYTSMSFGKRSEIMQNLNMTPREFDDIVKTETVYRVRDLYSFDQIKTHHKSRQAPTTKPRTTKRVPKEEAPAQPTPVGIDMETRIRHLEDLLLNVSIEVGQLRGEVAGIVPSLKEAVGKIDSLRRLAYEQEFPNQSNGVDA